MLKIQNAGLKKDLLNKNFSWKLRQLKTEKTDKIHILLCSAGVTWILQKETLFGQWALICFVSAPENICCHVIIRINTNLCLWASVGTHEGIQMNMMYKQEYGCPCEEGRGWQIKSTAFVHGNYSGPEQCSLVWVVKGRIHQFTSDRGFVSQWKRQEKESTAEEWVKG
jgi:hypothetical protein